MLQKHYRNDCSVDNFVAKAAGNLPPSKTAVNSLVSKMSHTAALPVQSNGKIR